MIQVLYKYCFQYKIPFNKLNQSYIESLTKVVQRTMEYGVLEGSEAIKLLVVANKYKKILTRSGRKHMVSVSHEFVKSVIETIQRKEVTAFAYFDDIQKFECSFNIFKHYLDIKFRLEGARNPDSVKKILSFRFIENHKITMWLYKSQSLLIKFNDKTDIKTITLQDLLTSFNCDLFDFNSYQFLVHSCQFVVVVNGKILCKWKLPNSNSQAFSYNSFV